MLVQCSHPAHDIDDSHYDPQAAEPVFSTQGRGDLVQRAVFIEAPCVKPNESAACVAQEKVYPIKSRI